MSNKIYFSFFQRQANNPSSSSGYSKSNPYQSQLYDSWKTEWNAPYTEQYRSGPSGAPSRGSSAEMVPSAHRPKGSSSYMTKGGRRLAYDDDFWLKLKLFVKQNMLRTFKRYPFREKSVHIQWKKNETKRQTKIKSPRIVRNIHLNPWLVSPLAQPFHSGQFSQKINYFSRRNTDLVI